MLQLVTVTTHGPFTVNVPRSFNRTNTTLALADLQT